MKKLNKEQMEIYSNFMVDLYSCIIKVADFGKKELSINIDKNIKPMINNIIDELKPSYKTYIGNYNNIKILSISWN